MSTKPQQSDFKLTAADREILRNLARRVAEIGNDPVQQEKVEMWYRHNDLDRVRPMVLTFPEGSWRELLPHSELKVENDFWRSYEYDLRMRIYYRDHLPDDNVIEPVVVSPIITQNSGWGIENQVTHSEEQLGAYHIEPVISDEADVDKLQIPQITLDREATECHLNAVSEIFGDILEVEQRGTFRGGICPMDTYSRLRGIDNLFMDLIDKPELVHRIVKIIIDGNISMIKQAEGLQILTLGNRNHYAGSGGTSYTRELPQPDFDGQHSKRILDYAQPLHLPIPIYYPVGPLVLLHIC